MKMFDYLKTADNRVPPRKFDANNPHHLAQAKVDAYGSFGTHDPLKERLRVLMNFYKSNESEETSSVGS